MKIKSELNKTKKTTMLYKASPCLFFYVNGEFLIHGCDLSDAENYGDFLIYPESHFDIWEKHYFKKYGVDFDYFPRGRVAYRKSTDTFQILYDRCINNEIHKFAEEHYVGNVTFGFDEHYQCHMCNEGYVI